MKDFELRFKPDPIANPHNLSAFDKFPKYHQDRQNFIDARNEEIEKFMAAGKPHDWIKYHDLPGKLQSIDQNPETLFLEKDKWTPAYLELARTMKDDFVYGKPKLDLFYLGAKAGDHNTELDGTKKPFKLIN